MTLEKRATPTCQASCMVLNLDGFVDGIIQESEVAVDAEVEVGAEVEVEVGS